MIAFRANGSFNGFANVIFEVILINFDPDHGAEKGRNQVASNENHVKIEDGVESVCKIASALEFDEDLIGSDLEILVDVAEEGHGVILKVLTGVHEHGVEDKAVEHDDNGDENSHDDG